MYNEEINKQKKVTLDTVNQAMKDLDEYLRDSMSPESIALNALRIEVQHKLPKTSEEAGKEVIQRLNLFDIVLHLIRKITKDQPSILGKLTYELRHLTTLYVREIYEIPKDECKPIDHNYPRLRYGN